MLITQMLIYISWAKNC